MIEKTIAHGSGAGRLTAMTSAEILQAVQAFVQPLMIQLQTQNMDNLAILAKQNADTLVAVMQQTRAQGAMTDSRGVGRPIAFKGEERKYPEWKAKLMAYLRVSQREADQWVQWASIETSEVNDQSILNHFGQDVGRAVSEFATKLYSTLMSCAEEDAFRICHSVKNGNGLEAMRLLVKRFEPRTPGTKRAVLKSIINNPAARKTEDMEANLMKVEELIKKYEHLSTETLPQDLKVTVIIDLCVKELKEHLELITRDLTYQEVREEILSYVERKRETFGVQLKAMEIDNYERTGYWGEVEDGQWDENGCHECEDHGEMYSFQKGYKGKGKGKSNYNTWGKGGSWNTKGGEWKGKGKGQDFKGKGKGGGGFQGTCFFCGEFGHSQSRCKEKDKYMEGVREKGGGKGGGAAWNVEEAEEERARRDLSTLEQTPWRTLCSMEHEAPWTVVMKGNRWGNNNTKPKELFGMETMKTETKKTENKKTENKKTENKKTENKKTETKKAETKKTENKKEKELNALDNHSRTLVLTIDSGASENVIGQHVVPECPTRPSAGSRAGVTYVAANGMQMPNRGEKRVKVKTKEGCCCELKMQVTDVRKPLMSVSKICDAGHQVTFTSAGGEIMEIGTGKVTRFDRVDDVYRLEVELPEATVYGGGWAEGFSRQDA